MIYNLVNTSIFGAWSPYYISICCEYGNER